MNFLCIIINETFYFSMESALTKYSFGFFTTQSKTENEVKDNNSEDKNNREDARSTIEKD